ncbi:sulfatase-like hydrolase/transferase [bacterium]|nr:sulfatase-like hydrolase/transferase [bacterium]
MAKTSRRNFLKNSAALFSSTVVPQWAGAKSEGGQPPNIVLIMADDLGYGSVGCYGAASKAVQTPHIDRLARGGVRFTDASTPSSVCSPTRYGLLMGRYPWRTRMKYGVVNVGDPLLPDPKRMSLARFLKQKGYQTAAIGKWHLGYGNKQKQPEDWTKPLRPGALEMGFDYHFAVPQNHGDKTGVYVENDRIFGLESNKVYPYSRTYYGPPYFGFDAPQRDNKQVMNDLTNKAVDWLKQSSDKPFFLYFTPVAVHHPITPSNTMRGESGCGPYGDFIQDLDLSIGRIFDTLKAKGVDENTLILVTSDNGGDIPPQPDRPESVARKLGLEINGSLRGDKHTIWEGGVRVPFIARWPEKIPAGATTPTMINLTDVFATVVEILDGKPSLKTEMAPDSVSFCRSLFHPNQKTDTPRAEMIVTNAQGIFAIRMGPWKYIEGQLPATWKRNRKGTYQGQAVRQLYNLQNDPNEKNNIIEAHPEIAEKMQQRLDAVRS